MTTFVLKQLLALYFPIIYSWKLSSSEKSLFQKNVHPYVPQRFYRFLLHRYLSFFYFDKCLCCPCWLRKVYAVLWAGNCFVALEIPKHNAFDLIEENFKNLNSISNIFQETHDFLVLMDSVIACIYFLERASIISFKKNKLQQTFSWPAERLSSHLKVIKMRFGPKIKYLSGLILADFCCRETIFCYF